MGRVWAEHGQNVGRAWAECSRAWAECGQSMGRVWAECGQSMGRVLAEHWLSTRYCVCTWLVLDRWEPCSACLLISAELSTAHIPLNCTCILFPVCLAVCRCESYLYFTSCLSGCVQVWIVPIFHFLFTWLCAGVNCIYTSLPVYLAVCRCELYTYFTSCLPGCVQVWIVHIFHFLFTWLCAGVSCTHISLPFYLAVCRCEWQGGWVALLHHWHWQCSWLCPWSPLCQKCFSRREPG